MSTSHLTKFVFHAESFDVKFIETMKVKEGVSCDVYQFLHDSKKDLAIVTVSPGSKTPLQKILGGEKTIEGWVSGTGKLTVTVLNGERHIYDVKDNATDEFSVELHMGDLVQWQASSESQLKFFEICYPPYKDGRFENLAE